MNVQPLDCDRLSDVHPLLGSIASDNSILNLEFLKKEKKAVSKGLRTSNYRGSNFSFKIIN